MNVTEAAAFADRLAQCAADPTKNLTAKARRDAEKQARAWRNAADVLRRLASGESRNGATA